MSRKGHKGALLKEEGATPTLHDLVYSIMSKPDLMFSSISDSCTLSTPQPTWWQLRTTPQVLQELRASCKVDCESTIRSVRSETSLRGLPHTSDPSLPAGESP
jgi:hypothetical protein